MGQKRWDPRVASFLALAAAVITAVITMSAANSWADDLKSRNQIPLQEMGTFYAGGTVLENDLGDTFHGDHAYVQYFIPPKAKKYPIVLLHGGGLSGSIWDVRWDGGEGFVQLLLRRGWKVYVVDQPRRGRAGRAIEGRTIPNPTPSESGTFTTFRLGVWKPPAAPQLYPGVQFPGTTEALNMFFRQNTPATGPGSAEHTPPEVISDAIVAVLDKIGPAIVVGHSSGGLTALLTGTKTTKIKAIVGYESPRFLYPEGDIIPTNPPGRFPPLPVPAAGFENLLKFPIQEVFGDNIPCTACTPLVQWGEHVTNAQSFADFVNARGGNVQLLHLPDLGIRGNTHFPFQDLNNDKVANQLFHFLHANRLDDSDR